MTQIQKNISLKPFNTFGMDGTAKFFVEANTMEDLQSLWQDALWKAQKKLILGGGSNILFTQDFTGLVVKINLKGKTIIRENKDLQAVIVEAGSGENWHEFVQWTLEHNLGGLENLALIPGTVGAAPVQNIGAYGVEIKDRLVSVEVLEITTGKMRNFLRDELQLGYRDSIFKREAMGKYIITKVRFALTTESHQLKMDYGAIKSELEQMAVTPSIQTISQAVIRIRQQKLPDPGIIGNGGSFFKNPVISSEQYYFLQEQFIDMPGYEIRDQRVDNKDQMVDIIQYKIPAAWLIDQCGWKGYRKGDAGVHENQPLVLVNYGQATGAQILALSQEIQSNVYEAFGIELEREINVV